jgi:hypothetical protein
MTAGAVRWWSKAVIPPGPTRMCTTSWSPEKIPHVWNRFSWYSRAGDSWDQLLYFCWDLLKLIRFLQSPGLYYILKRREINRFFAHPRSQAEHTRWFGSVAGWFSSLLPSLQHLALQPSAISYCTLQSFRENHRKLLGIFHVKWPEGDSLPSPSRNAGFILRFLTRISTFGWKSMTRPLDGTATKSFACWSQQAGQFLSEDWLKGKSTQ